MANVTSNFWWFVVTYSFKDFYIYAGPHVPFLVYGVVCLLGFIFIYVFLPETQASSHEKLKPRKKTLGPFWADKRPT